MGNIFSPHRKPATGRPMPIAVHTVETESTRVSKTHRLPLTRKEYYGPSPSPKTRITFRQTPRSRAWDRSKASFLDLPAEIRNNIYSRVLICEGYIRVMPKAPTKVAALVLLGTCKQIHDEAASIFYAANSFYVNTRKDIRHIPGKKMEFPDLGGLCTVHNGLSKAGGLLFPAPRYHVYLTRLTIDAKLFLPVLDPQSGSRPPLDACELAAHDLQRVLEELDKRLIDVYTRMRRLWEEKERRWEGKLVTAEQNGPDRVVMVISMSFSEEEEEEIATKGMLKLLADT